MMMAIMRRMFLFGLIILLMAGLTPGFSESAGSVDILTKAQNGGEVSYPQLSGFANAFVQDSINQAILSEGGIQDHLNAMSAFTEAVPGNLKVTSAAQILRSGSGQDLLSVLIEARGNLSFGPPSHRYTPLVFSLATGQRIACSQIFSDCEQARSAMEERLEEELDGELSNYLDTGDLYPFPIDRFLLTETGISFFYPERGMMWLSGKSAFLHFHYSELAGLIREDEGAALKGLRLFESLKLTDASRQAIAASAAAGALPGLPVKAGDDLKGMLEEYPLLHDPEGFVSGQKYQLEDDRFRGSWVLSLDGQVISGLFSRRINFYGLHTGESSLDAVKGALGEPSGTVALSQEAAQLYDVPAGSMLEYSFPDAGTIKLFLDGNQVLSAVWLDGMKAE